MTLMIDGPEDAALTLVFGHGAGLPMDAPFMTTFAQGLAAKGYRVVRFEFPYMAERRETGTKRPPDRLPALAQAFGVAVNAAQIPADRLVLAGKSMGGRLATILVDEAGARAAVVFGYPFHPPQKPENLRTKHLEKVQAPVLICQGTRDNFGTKKEVEGYSLSPAVEIAWIEDGDHHFVPRQASGRTEEQNCAAAIDAATAFLDRIAIG